MIATLKDISKTYLAPDSGKSTQVLRSISLDVEKNEAIAITGPSGSGKSTLLNLLGTLDKPTSGSVILLGTNISNLTENDLAQLRNQSIGFIFQLHHLLPQLTLLENVLLPLLPVKDPELHKKAGKRALILAEKIGLSDHLHNKPYQMSVGECQRAAMIRALINQPGLLLADEPTGSLDMDNARILADLLFELKSEYGFSLVTVTHSMELAKRHDSVYRLVSGNLTRQEPEKGIE